MPLYNLYITGEFTDGTAPQAAIAAFARASGISEERAQALFDQAPSAIKRNVDEATAQSYQEKLAGLGIITRLEAIENEIPVAGTTAAEAAASPADTAPAGKRHVGFVFNGQGYEYFKIWIVNILLTIVTLGIYAPWAKVRNTQYFYGNTQLDGASFAFTADPVKMLIGRLIALGLFVLYLFIVTAFPLTGFVFGFGFLFLFPWVMNRALAFYARNTRYRNIRFRFNGSYWGAFKVTVLWPIAAAFTFMLLFPLALKKQQEYMINNHCYGNKSFVFNTGTGNYYGIVLTSLGLVILALALGAGLASITPVLGGIVAALGYIGSFVYAIVRLQNLVFNNTSLANHDFKSDYQLKSYGLLMVSNFLLLLVTLGLYFPWAKVRLAHYAANHTAMDVDGDLDKFAAVSQEDPSAFGEEFSDVFDMEVGF